MSWQTIHNLGQWFEFNSDLGELRIRYERVPRAFVVDLFLAAGPLSGQQLTARAETLTKAVNAVFKDRDAAFAELRRQGGKGRKRRAAGSIADAVRKLTR